MPSLFSISLYSIFILLGVSFSSNPHWLVEIDCEDNLNFFELHTLNTYNLSECNPSNSLCGEYINLMHYSIFYNNKIYSNHCEVGSRLIEYSLTPVNMAGSTYDLTPHFIINITVDKQKVIEDLPLFPSPLYNKSLWGLKFASVRLNNNIGSIEVIISDDELYQESNSNKMKPYISWLWDSSYISAFDPKWKSKWKPIRESDIWHEKNFNKEKD